MARGTGLCAIFVLVMAVASASSAAPSISSVSGTVSHGGSITISGSAFGSKSTAAPAFWDTIDNQSAYSGLSDGDDIPTSSGYPWGENSTYGDKVEYCTSRTMRGQETAHYHWYGKGYLGWPRAVDSVKGNQFYVNYWWRPTQAPDDPDGAKFLRIWDDSGGNGTRISFCHGSIYWTTPTSGLTTSYGHWGGSVNQWNNMEVWVDADSHVIKVWVNGDQIHNMSGFYKENNGIGFSLPRVGMDPRYGQYYTSMHNDMADIYIDVSQAKVYIGNSTAYSSCTHRELQIPSAWSSSSITATVNQGSFSSGTAYLYVVDSSGSYNSSGYQISLSGGTTYSLTVNSGTGDGNYSQGSVVNIAADTAASGQEFDDWVGNTSGIADVNDSTTTLTMPASNQEITATYQALTLYTLTVNSGTGDGSYQENWVVDIDADSAPSGQSFDEWVGDTEGIASVTSSSTTLTMPASAAEITATYQSVATYALTVNSGSGDGSYAQGTIVDISADAAASGYAFDEWVGDTEGIAGVTSSSTTLTMPASATEVTATYEVATAYALTVNSGTGDGNYTQSTVVDIDADTAASGMLFDAWIGDTANISDVNDPSGTLTMPASEQEITATYSWVASGLVSRFTFDTDARDTYGTSDGTLTNGAAVANDGTRGKVVSLDGDNDYVSLPSSAMAAGRSELTLCMWVNPDTWVSGDTIYDEYASSNYWQFTLANAAFRTRDSSTGTTGSRDNDLSMSSLSTSTWQHIALVYSSSGNNKQIYIDGVSDTSTSTSVDTLTSSRDGVGLGYACDGNHFDGLIDDVRLYSRALSANEIALLAGLEYTLTVNSGTGDGDYTPMTVVDISADSAPSGQDFDEWVGDTDGIASVSSESTTLTMPYENAETTATYTDKTWTLTVNSGSGDGDYVVAAVVDITADTAPSGYTFDIWVGDASGIADDRDPTTTITMPYADAEITATYEFLAVEYTLTVNSGTGDGNYDEGAIVDISANSPPSGRLFDVWTGDTTGIAKVGSASTTITMPSNDVEITATYTEVVDGLVSRYTFDVDGSDCYGTNEGTLHGASVTNDGTRGMVLSLDGIDDYVDLPTSGMAAGRSEISLTMWINPDEWLSDNTIYEEHNNNWWQFTIREDKWYTRDSSTGTSGSRNNDVSLPNISTGQWSHLAFVYSVNGGKKEIYLDGVKQGSSTTSIDAITSSRTDVRVGWPSDGAYYDGMIDDMRLYSKALSLTEIALLAEKTVYTLTVNSGSGDGSYCEDQVIDISADGAPTGYVFDKWIGDTSGIASDTSSSTTITMPASNTEITASYSSTGYTLTVNSGTGGGVYNENDTPTITADTAPSGQDFDEWAGDTDGIANVNASPTTLTMPAANQEVTATYTDKAWTLTVNSGTGDGSYVVGTIQSITADAAPSGQDFDEWVGDTDGIASVTSSSTTITMPYANAEVTATYTDKTWTLTVNSGTGDGSYAVDTITPISADAAPSGQDFDEWVGDTACVDSVGSSSTNLTMPYGNAEVTATYTDKTWTLTVNSGTGDGSYVVGTIQSITADAAPSGQDFDEWVGDTDGIASVTSSSTTITMPYANAEVTATYTDKTWTLTVNSGTGDGSYVVGTIQSITADSPASGKQFAEWVGDTDGIASVTSSSTTITMPYSNAEITATYDDAATGTETIHFREGGGTGYTDVTFDDTWIATYPATDNTYGNDNYNGIYAKDDYPTAVRVSLIAVKDMFTELPATTSGKDIVIASATLYLYRYQGSSSTTVYVNRVTTDWLPDAAGSNENDVSGEHAEKSESTDWASGDFSTSDYDTSETDSGSWSSDYNGEVTIDVTDVIADIYDAGNNYGVVITTDGPSIYGRASEYTQAYRPSLEITYYYE